MVSSYQRIRLYVVRISTRAAFCAVLLLLNGCSSKYVLVETRLASISNPSAAEVTETAQYHKILPKITHVAVQAPDRCENRGIAEVTGTARKRDSVASTNCGIQMAELERALSRAGYAVISWKSLENMVQADHVTPISAARNLGAQILFQINSMERVDSQSTIDSGLYRIYHKSNQDGAILGQADLSMDTRPEILKLIEPHEKKWIQNGRNIGATLDMNAVYVASGQTVWFYRWVNPKNVVSSNSAILVYAHGDSPWELGARQPNAAEQMREQMLMASSEPSNTSIMGTSTGSIDTLYFELLRETVLNCVKRFSKQTPSPTQ